MTTFVREDVGMTRPRKAIAAEAVFSIYMQTVKYDPDTGEFVRTERRGRHPSGVIRGSIDSYGYRQICLAGRYFLAHRLAWFWTFKEWPDCDIDHINGDRSDNRIVNLRLASRSQNGGNTRKSAANTSGFKGVSLQNGRWKAQICFNRKKLHIGMFATPEAAHAAYLAEARRLFGEFARSA